LLFKAICPQLQLGEIAIIFIALFLCFLICFLVIELSINYKY